MKGVIATMTFENLGLSVSSLYAGGWRSGDADDLKAEYNLTEEETSIICEAIAELEQKKGE